MIAFTPLIESHPLLALAATALICLAVGFWLGWELRG